MRGLHRNVLETQIISNLYDVHFILSSNYSASCFFHHSMPPATMTHSPAGASAGRHSDVQSGRSVVPARRRHTGVCCLWFCIVLQTLHETNVPIKVIDCVIYVNSCDNPVTCSCLSICLFSCWFFMVTKCLLTKLKINKNTRQPETNFLFETGSSADTYGSLTHAHDPSVNMGA